jgi:hypothetical protein
MSAITVTLAEIKLAQPCISGWRKVIEANGGMGAIPDKPFPVSSIIDSNGLQDAFWVISECTRIAKDHSMLWRKLSCWMIAQIITDDVDKVAKDCFEIIKRYCNGSASLGALRHVNDRIGDTLDSLTVCGAKWHLYNALFLASQDTADVWLCSCECALSRKTQSCVGISHANTYDRKIALDKAEEERMAIHEKKFRAILDLGRWED